MVPGSAAAQAPAGRAGVANQHRAGDPCCRTWRPAWRWRHPAAGRGALRLAGEAYLPLPAGQGHGDGQPRRGAGRLTQGVARQDGHQHRRQEPRAGARPDRADFPLPDPMERDSIPVPQPPSFALDAGPPRDSPRRQIQCGSQGTGRAAQPVPPDLPKSAGSTGLANRTWTPHCFPTAWWMAKAACFWKKPGCQRGSQLQRHPVPLEESCGSAPAPGGWTISRRVSGQPEAGACGLSGCPRRSRGGRAGAASLAAARGREGHNSPLTAAGSGPFKRPHPPPVAPPSGRVRQANGCPASTAGARWPADCCPAARRDEPEAAPYPATLLCRAGSRRPRRPLCQVVPWLRVTCRWRRGRASGSAAGRCRSGPWPQRPDVAPGGVALRAVGAGADLDFPAITEISPSRP
jgi:hypothetical protein